MTSSKTLKHNNNLCKIPICSYLTHLCDGVIKDPACIICSLSHQFDLPGPWGQPKVWGVQLHNLTCNLHKDRFTLPPPGDYRAKEKRNVFINTKLSLKKKKVSGIIGKKFCGRFHFAFLLRSSSNKEKLLHYVLTVHSSQSMCFWLLMASL